MPIFSVSTTTAVPGTKITVSGQNFSGCAAQGNPHQPTPELTVKVGVITAAKVTEVLATTTTSATGSFSVQITVPTVPSGGANKIALAAESMDPVTGLTYEGIAAISYPVTPPTTASTPTTEPSTTTPSTIPQTSSTSVDIPTAVPAGTGGLAAPTSANTMAVELGIGAAGLLLAGFGGIGLARRRHQH